LFKSGTELWYWQPSPLQGVLPWLELRWRESRRSQSEFESRPPDHHAQ